MVSVTGSSPGGHREGERTVAGGTFVLLGGADGHLDRLACGTLEGRYRIPRFTGGNRSRPVVGARDGEGYARLGRCGVGRKRDRVVVQPLDVEAGRCAGLLLDGDGLDGLTVDLDEDMARAGFGRLVLGGCKERLVVGQARGAHRGDAARERCAVVGARAGRTAAYGRDGEPVAVALGAPCLVDADGVEQRGAILRYLVRGVVGAGRRVVDNLLVERRIDGLRLGSLGPFVGCTRDGDVVQIETALHGALAAEGNLRLGRCAVDEYRVAGPAPDVGHLDADFALLHAVDGGRGRYRDIEVRVAVVD